jgi:hypothetical protein
MSVRGRARIPGRCAPPALLIARLPVAGLLVAGMLAAGCASKHDPAQVLLGEMHGALLTAGPDAARFAPDRLRAVEAQVGELQAAFERKQYDAVLARGPAVLAAAQQLAADAAADQQSAHQALVADWTRLADTLPDRLMRIGMRIASPAPGAHAHVPVPVHALAMDRADAQRALQDANALWSKARSAFASGNLAEAVHSAKDAAARVDALAPRVGL